MRDAARDSRQRLPASDAPAAGDWGGRGAPVTRNRDLARNLAGTGAVTARMVTLSAAVARLVAHHQRADRTRAHQAARQGGRMADDQGIVRIAVLRERAGYEAVVARIRSSRCVGSGRRASRRFSAFTCLTVLRDLGATTEPFLFA